MLEEEKRSKIIFFKYNRNREEQYPVTYNDKQFDFDETSQSRLQLVYLVLQDTDTKIEWTCADDTSTTIGADDIKAIFAEAVQRGNTLHEKYRVLRDKINACSTEEELAEIEW